MPYPEQTNEPNFRCPICRSALYAEVAVKKTNGILYKTAFLQCAGCSVMFTDPLKFTRFEPYVAPSPTKAERAKETRRLEYFGQREGD